MTRDEFEIMLDDHAFGWTGTSGILAEYDRLTAVNAQLLEACKKAQNKLRSTQENWHEESLFEADDILSAAIRAAEEMP